MKKAEFLEELAKVLVVSADALKPPVELASFDAWDSTAVINLIVLLDEQGVPVDEDKIPDCKTVGDVLALAGDALT